MREWRNRYREKSNNIHAANIRVGNNSPLRVRFPRSHVNINRTRVVGHKTTGNRIPRSKNLIGLSIIWRAHNNSRWVRVYYSYFVFILIVIKKIGIYDIYIYIYIGYSTSSHIFFFSFAVRSQHLRIRGGCYPSPPSTAQTTVRHAARRLTQHSHMLRDR